jgi:hypothetical protein
VFGSEASGVVPEDRESWIRKRLAEISYWDLTIQFLLAGFSTNVTVLVQSVMRRSWFLCSKKKNSSGTHGWGKVG